MRYLIPLAERLERELKKAKRIAGPRRSSRRSTRREWPEREFDELGYLRIKGARSLDPKALSVLRALYLVRDRRAREIDRPPFKVLGNRTLLEIAERRPAKSAELAEIKGVTELILRRFGREMLAAVGARRARRRTGRFRRLAAATARRRMDRQRRAASRALKRWRSRARAELALDPGVLCPNSALEAIALARTRRAPRTSRGSPRSRAGSRASSAAR